MFSVSTNFTQVGDRDYIQGIHIADTMLRAVFNWSPPGVSWLNVEAIKFVKKTLLNGTVIVVPNPEEITDMPPCAVSLRGASDNGGSFIAQFIPNNACPVSKHIKAETARISSIRKGHNFAGVFDVSWSDSDSYLKTLVEANKRAIKHSLPESDQKAVIEITAVERLFMPLALLPFDGELCIRNLGVRSFGPLLYVQNSLSWTGITGRSPLTLTYSVRQAQS